MSAYDHVPGQRDFLILDKEVSLTEFRRKPSVVWKFLETPGYVVFITRRGKPICRIVSIETYACMTNDYKATMAEIDLACKAYNEQRKAARREKRHESKNP